MSAYMPLAGDIGVTRITGAVGFGIRLGQWLNGSGYANYEHAFVYVGHGLIVEAMPGGARLARLDQYPPGTVRWLVPERGALNLRGIAIQRRAYSLVGTPYSFLDYLAIAAVRLRLPSKRLRKYVANSGHMICSQLADEAWRRAGVQMFNDGRPAGLVTPGDINKLIDRTLTAVANGA